MRVVLPSLSPRFRCTARALLRAYPVRDAAPLDGKRAASPLPIYDVSVLFRRLAERSPVTPEGVLAAAMARASAEQRVTGAGDPAPTLSREIVGQLAETLLREPGSVVLLDEIEKAHPAARNLLLQVFSGGRISEGRKRVVDGSRAVFVMTTNLGWSGMRDALGFRTPSRTAVSAGHVRSLLARFLSPEFLNRIDAIVPFHELNRSALREIVIQEVDRFHEAAAQRGVGLEVDDAIVERVLDQVEAWTDSGARVVRRMVEEVMARPLAVRMRGVPGEVGGATG